MKNRSFHCPDSVEMMALIVTISEIIDHFSLFSLRTNFIHSFLFTYLVLLCTYLSIYLICSFIYFFRSSTNYQLGLMWWFGLVVLGNLLAFEVDFITAELQHLNVLEEVPSCNENRFGRRSVGVGHQNQGIFHHKMGNFHHNQEFKPRHGDGLKFKRKMVSILIQRNMWNSRGGRFQQP